MTPPVESRIDFRKEAEEIGFKIPGSDFGQQDAEDIIFEFGRSIAARVEEQTIQRCRDAATDDRFDKVGRVKRLYSSAQDGGKG